MKSTQEDFRDGNFTKLLETRLYCGMKIKKKVNLLRLLLFFKQKIIITTKLHQTSFSQIILTEIFTP